MTAAIRTAPPKTRTEPPPQPSVKPGWTDVKIQRVWRTAAALIGVLAAAGFGVAALTSKAVYLAAAIPLTAVSAYLFHSLNRLHDFQNPAELAEIKRTAARMPLPQIVETYGWSPLFRYQILNPSQFETAFIDHAGKISFNELLSFFEKAEAELKQAGSPAFQIPQLDRWWGKFAAETAKMTCGEILSSYPIDKLSYYRIIDEPSFAILSEGRGAQEEFGQIKTALEQEFTQRTKPQRDFCMIKEELARKKYSTALLESQIHQLRFTYQHSIQSEEKIAQAEMKAEQALFCSPDPCLRTAAQSRFAAIREALELRKSALYQIYAQGCSSIDLQIASMKQMEQSEIVQARTEYENAVKPIRMEINGRISRAHAELDYHLRKLDETYRKVQLSR